MFILTKNDCLELETLFDLDNKWDSDASISLLEGGRNIWYCCNSKKVKGIFVSRKFEYEKEWFAYQYTDDMKYDVDEAYIRDKNGKILMHENVNKLVKMVEEYTNLL